MEVNFVKRFPSVEEGRKSKTIYLERAPNQRYFTIYVTFTDPKDYTSSIAESEIGTLVAQAVSGVSQSHFVDDIAARDKLLSEDLLKVDSIVLVKDATADVKFKGTGGLGYFYSSKTQTFIPAFRMPVDPMASPKWNDFEGAPESTGEEIDAAVGKAHDHGNKNVLDGLSVAETGTSTEEGQKTSVLLFEGKLVGTPVTVNPQW